MTPVKASALAASGVGGRGRTTPVRVIQPPVTEPNMACGATRGNPTATIAHGETPGSVTGQAGRQWSIRQPFRSGTSTVDVCFTEHDSARPIRESSAHGATIHQTHGRPVSPGPLTSLSYLLNSLFSIVRTFEGV